MYYVVLMFALKVKNHLCCHLTPFWPGLCLTWLPLLFQLNRYLVHLSPQQLLCCLRKN